MQVFERGDMPLRMAFLVAAVATLAACGGGGGGGDGSTANTPAAPAPSSTDVDAAYTAALRQPHTYSLTGTASTGTSVMATLSIAPASTASYNGVSYDTTTLTSTVNVAGSPVSTSVTTLWLQQGSTALAFEASSMDTTCMYTSAQSALPHSASLGQQGPYATSAEYPGCTHPGTIYTYDLSVGTVTQTWSYIAIKGRGYVCMTSSDAGPVGTSTEQDCFEVIDANGTLGTRAQVTIHDLNGVTITLSTS